MSYTINTTSGNVLVTLPDGTKDVSTGLTLIGRNYTGYGVLQNDNFVRLLENFASDLPPGESVGFSPLPGTLWFDTARQSLRLYDGINWNPVSGTIISSTTPVTSGNVSLHIGDQWWDTVNKQLRTWDGSSWYLIGPNYTPGQAKTGTYADTVLDTVNVPHVVSATYVGNNLVAVTSYDAEFAVNPSNGAPYEQFATIKPGINLVSGTVYQGTASNSLAVGNVAIGNIARTDITSSFNSSINVAGNVNVGYSNIGFVNNELTIKNSAYTSNIAVSVSTPLGTTRALVVDGNSGLVTVKGNPTTNLGVATKQYVDSTFSNVTTTVATQLATLSTDINDVYAEFIAGNTILASALADAIDSTTTYTDNAVAGLAALTAANVATFNTTVSGHTTTLNNINNNILPSKAPINNPTFTGLVTLPAPDSSSSSTQAATTYFVSNAISYIYNNLATRINSLTSTTSSTATDIRNALTANVGVITTAALSTDANVETLNTYVKTLATINSPVLTGRPQVPPVPALVTYLNNYSATTFTLSLSDNASFTVNTILKQVDAVLFTEIATMKVLASTTNSKLVTIQLLSGSMVPSASNLVYANDVLVTTHIIGFNLSLLYSGLGDSSSAIASTGYVDATANLLYSTLSTQVTNERVRSQADLTNAIANVAPIDSATLTGEPSAPTPHSGDASTKIATTAFVSTAITNLAGTVPSITISGSAPTDGQGKNGDFWFQT